MKLLAAGSSVRRRLIDHSGMITPTPRTHSDMEHSGIGHGGAERIEWEDDMVEVNRQTPAPPCHWQFLDRTTGADSPAIDWRFTVGDR